MIAGGLWKLISFIPKDIPVVMGGVFKKLLPKSGEALEASKMLFKNTATEGLEQAVARTEDAAKMLKGLLGESSGIRESFVNDMISNIRSNKDVIQTALDNIVLVKKGITDANVIKQYEILEQILSGAQTDITRIGKNFKPDETLNTLSELDDFLKKNKTIFDNKIEHNIQQVIDNIQLATNKLYKVKSVDISSFSESQFLKRYLDLLKPENKDQFDLFLANENNYKKFKRDKRNLHY